MFLLRIFKWLVLAFIASLLAVALYLNFADLNWLKPRIESAVVNMTGRQLKLNGPFELKLVPAPAIVLEDVSLSGPAGAAEPMLSVGHASARLDLWSLFSGPVRLDELRLREVDLVLEQVQQEVDHGGLEQPPECIYSGGDMAGGLPVMIEFAELRDIAVRFVRPGSAPLSLYLAALDISTDAEQYTVLQAEGEVNALPLKLAGRLGPEAALSAGTGIRLDTDANVGDLAAALKATQQDRALSLDASVASLDKLGKVLGIQDLPAIPLQLLLTASMTCEHLLLEQIESHFGDSDLSGSLEVALGDRPGVAGRIRSQRLDLTPFAAASPQADGVEDSQANAATNMKQENHYVFVEDPLPFEQLERIDIDVAADIDRLTLNDLLLLDVSTRVDLQHGTLQSENRYIGPDGGKAVSHVALTTEGSSASLDLKVDMRDLRLNLISGDVSDPALIPPVDITLDLKASGGSPRALASSANGRVLVTQGAGRVQNELVGKLSGDVFAELFNSLNPFAKNEKFTTLDCTILALDITSGRADITAMYSQGEKIAIVGGGDIDLRTEALNIEFNTKPRQGIGVTPDMFVTPFVKLVGTLSNPRVGADQKGALLAGATLATGGLALVAKGIVDRASGEKDLCPELLEEIGGHLPLEE